MQKYLQLHLEQKKNRKKHVSKIQYNHFRNNKQYEIIYKT